MSRLAMEPTSRTGSETYSSGLADARSYISWVVDQFRAYLRGRILEVGIGHGSYCEVLAHHGDYVGIDIDEAEVRSSRALFPDRSFETCDITDRDQIASVIPDGADSILCLNVIEHIEDDGKAVANLVSTLRPGGHLLLGVPAHMALFNDMDRLAGHLRRYDTGTVRRLMSNQPVDILELRYFNPVGGLGWWANRFKRHQALESEAIKRQIRIFDTYLLPISRVLDPVFRSVFGQSVVCVARRR